MKNRLLIAFIATTCFLTSANEVFACRCQTRLNSDRSTPQQEFKREFKKAKAVFSGKVMSIDDKCRENVSGCDVRITFEVNKSWKYIRKDIVVVMTGSPQGDNCGFFFEVGQEYLVFAFDEGGAGLETHICSRTKPIADEQAGEDLKRLGKSLTLN